jgi:hypothetical protein
MSQATDLIHTVRFGDYQKKDGSWGYGVVNAEDIADKLKSLLLSEAVTLDWKEIEPGKWSKTDYVPIEAIDRLFGE